MKNLIILVLAIIITALLCQNKDNVDILSKNASDVKGVIVDKLNKMDKIPFTIKEETFFEEEK